MIRRLKAGIRRNSGFSLNVMTDDEAHEIHLATLEVLRDTGVFVESQEAIEIYDGAGCCVDRKTKTVKFPGWLVEDAIRAAPASFVACGRRPEDDVILGDNRVTFTNFGEGIRFVDPYTGEHRDSTKADLEKAALIIDRLEHLETYERAMCSHDKPPQVQAIHNAEASITNTTKHQWLCPVDRNQIPKIIDMCAAIVGSREKLKKRPLLTFATYPISPLKLPKHHCEIIIDAARNGLAVNVTGMALAVDVIKELGIGKDYLSHQTTLQYMRSQSQADLIDRRMREDWEGAGRTDMYKRAHDKMIDILETHQPLALPENVRDTIRSIVVEAEKEIGLT